MMKKNQRLLKYIVFVMGCTIVSFKCINSTERCVGVNLNLQSEIVEFICAAGTVLSNHDALNLMGIE